MPKYPSEMMDFYPLKLLSEKDQLFSKTHYPKPFCFNEEVAQVFDDMVKRSIPFYSETAHILLSFAQLHTQEGSRIYDIGCSTASTLLFLSQNISHALTLTGLDNSEAMVRHAYEKMKEAKAQDTVHLYCENALDHPYHEASLIICNYTLQFMSIRERRDLLKRIYTGLKPGGMLFLSEKIRYADPHMQEMSTFIYESYKKQQGYSQNEIERKKEALEHVLIPVTLEEQLDWLRQSGFKTMEPVLKWHCFVSILAIKEG